MSDDYIKKLENSNPFVATEADLVHVGASIPSPRKMPVTATKKEEKSSDLKTPFVKEPIQFEDRVPVVAEKKDTAEETRDHDFEYMRTNFYNVIETSSNSLSELAQIAAQSQHPRAYEVLALLVKTIADANRDLMKIHQEKSQINIKENKPGEHITNNNLFVGSTADLDAIIKKMTKVEE